MDQNQTQTNPAVDNDLQKAIDNITNTTNTDPVFSDPVAAPSSVPEGDTGELDEPVGPFPEAQVATVTPGPEPIAPLESMNIPEFNAPSLTPEPTAPAPEPVMPAPEPISPEPAAPAPMMSPEPAASTMPESASLSTKEIKKAALQDLVPLLDKVNMNSSEKFKIYRDIFDSLKDYTVLDPAYQAAREIPDETERAEALLYLVNSIDKM